jgi:hypothetical protein
LTAARQIRFNRLDTSGCESSAPRDYLPATDFASPSIGLIAKPIGRQLNNPRTPDAAPVQRLRSHPMFGFNSLLTDHYVHCTLSRHSLKIKATNMISATSLVLNKLQEAR